MAEVRVKVDGLDDFRRDLRRVDDDEAMTKANKRVADLLEARTKAASPPHVARAISGSGGRLAAELVVGPSPPHALVGVMGAKRRTGWYSLPPYRESTGRQFPPWVGTSWDPGERGGAPYHLGPVINASVDDVADIYADEFEQAARRAFPDGH